nr:acetylcholinesterase isoform X1 [Macaca nemestrina]
MLGLVMSCPDRTLVTKVRGHPSGNQRRPTRGDSRSFHCHRGVRPRPAALRVPPRWPAFSGVPESPFPPPGSLLSPCPPTSFPLTIPCLHLHSHRCPFIPRSVPRHHFCTSATWTPNGTVLGHTPTCLSNHATPVSVVAVDAWPLGLALTSPASSETIRVSKCVRPSVKVGACVCLCLSLHEVVRLRVSVSTGFCPSVCHVGVCSAAAGLWVASVTARLSSVGVWRWNTACPAAMRPPQCPLHTPSLASPLLLLLLWLLGGGVGAEGREDAELLVTVRGGRLRGIRLKTPGGPVSAFLGIPFAEPPTGPRRFLPPEPKQPWSGVVDATTFQSVCYQYVDTLYPGFEGTEMWNPNRELSEDCLYLNVWTPYPRPTSPTPVLVWIYGGGFYSGASSLDVYDGRFLVQAERTVLVSMNYRVGAFGFLALPGSREAPGNVGLLDQRLALQWVQENVAAFGGDPTSVTLFGESAGAASVGMHLLSPPSRGLFHRAVLQSGAPNGPWATVGMGEARRRATQLAHLVGCPPGGTGGNDTELVACLRTRPAQVLVNNEWHVLPQESVFRFSFVPVVDGDFLSDTPEALINAGDFHGLQVLVGVVKDEGSYFLVYGAPGFSKDNESLISRAEFLAGVRVGVPQVSDLAAEAVVLHYTDWLHPEDPARLREALSDVVGDHNVVCPVAQLAGRLAAQGARVYAYVFEHRASTLSWPLWMGVPHGYEIEFIFGIPLDPSRNYTTEEKIFAQRLMRYWANFARTGDPNEPRDPKGPQWPPYTAGAQQYVSLDLRPLEVRRGLRAQACAFWNRFLPKLLSATASEAPSTCPGFTHGEAAPRPGLPLPLLLLHQLLLLLLSHLLRLSPRPLPLRPQGPLL